MTSRREDLTLSEDSLDPELHRQFGAWLQEAVQAGELMPNAMALATTATDGLPALRMVVLDDADERGFAFQTNLESPKAMQLNALPQAALVFFWPRLLRQVRVTGGVEPLTRQEVAAYFSAAPSAIQTMIRACRQSTVIADRAELEAAYAVARRKRGPPACERSKGTPSPRGGEREG